MNTTHATLPALARVTWRVETDSAITHYSQTVYTEAALTDRVQAAATKSTSGRFGVTVQRY